MELTPHLILMQWLLKHTFLLSGNENNQPITNNEIKNIFFKEFPETKEDLNKEINLLIGQFLKYIYGSKLIKYDAKPIKYNIGIVKNPIKEIFIQDYKGVYKFEYYQATNKYNYTDVKETYKSMLHLFKGVTTKQGNKKPLTQRDLIKCDNLAKDIIIYCLNKGIPKYILRYFLFYCMYFLNPKDLNLMLSDAKNEFKLNKVCAICGASENLTIHHVKEVSKAPHLEFNNNNFIVLCDRCHKEHHHKQDKKQSQQQRQQDFKEVVKYANL